MRPLLSSFLVFISIATAAFAPATAPTRPPAAVIPIDTGGFGPPFVRAKVKGTSFWLLLDTASPSAFGQRQAMAIDLPVEKSDIPIELPGITFTMRSVPIADLGPRQIALGHKLDGVLGSEFFARFLVKLDFQRNTLTVSDSRTVRRAGSGRFLPIAIEGGLPYAAADLAVRGPTPNGVAADTASDGAVTLYSPFVRERGLAGPPPTQPAGATGEMQGVTRGQSLDLGGFLLRDPLVVLSVSESGALADPGHAGLIGMEVLRRFTVTLDYQRKRVLLEKNAAFKASFDYDASGLRVQPQGQDLTTLEVRRVVPRSPGAEAGFEPGDVLLSVDGRPVGEITPPGVRRLFQKDGAQYTLSILRRGQIRKLQLKCRRAI
jgi:hypothetical protein